MEKEMEKEKNIIMMDIYHLKVNIYIIIKEKENIILIIDQNMKVNFYMIENGPEKDMMKMVK